jgi:hypothetical protein
VNAIKKVGGITCRVERGPRPTWYSDAISLNKGPRNIGWALAGKKLMDLGIHASEYSSVGIEYDHYIDNNGSIDELHKKIKSMINL